MSETERGIRVIDLSYTKGARFLISKFHNKFFIQVYSRDSNQGDKTLVSQVPIQQKEQQAASNVSIQSGEEIQQEKLSISKRSRKPLKPRKSKEVDILVITALPDEYKALLKCEDESFISWNKSLSRSTGHYYSYGVFKNESGKLFTVAAVRSTEMGGNSVAVLASTLASELKPRCLAMTGICAGYKSKVFLGDIVVAKRIFEIDRGKVFAHYKDLENGLQIREEENWGDFKSYNLNPQLQNRIEEFIEEYQQIIQKTIQERRPRTHEHQKYWLLYKIYDFQFNKKISPTVELVLEDSEYEIECPNWREICNYLRSESFLKQGSLELTRKGKLFVEKDFNGWKKDKLVSEIKVGVIGTTNKVQEDPKLFPSIKYVARSAIGIEMEGAAMGEVASIRNIPMIFVKAVSDYGDYDKNDQFRHYAAEASARFLIAFLKKEFPFSNQ